jgi:hypothetical protein
MYPSVTAEILATHDHIVRSEQGMGTGLGVFGNNG